MEKDIALKEYEQDPRHFCDLVNGILAEGRQLFRPEEILPMPTELAQIREVVREIAMQDPGEAVNGTATDSRAASKGGLEGAEDKSRMEGAAALEKQSPGGQTSLKMVQRFRDMTKKAAAGDGYFIIAVQNQGKVDFSMALRVMVEDALDYDAQKRSHRNGELRSGERLMPVVTIVFYYGASRWTAAEDLSGLIEVPAGYEELKKHVQRYPILLVTPQNVKPENFRTGWREIFEILQRQGDEAEMGRYLRENRERYAALPRDTNRLIFLLTDQGEYYKKLTVKGEEPTVCKAFEDHYQSGVRAGRKEGRAEGIELTQRRTAHSLADMGMPMEKIAQALQISLEKVSQWLAVAPAAQK